VSIDVRDNELAIRAAGARIKSCGRQPPGFEAFAPRNDMSACDLAELQRLLDTGERHETPQVILVRAPGMRVFQVREPFDFRRDLGQASKILVGEQRAALGVR